MIRLPSKFCAIAILLMVTGCATYPQNGQGTYTAAASTYVGAFRNGKYNGYGTYTYAVGAKYVGEWKDGKQHGQGTFTVVSPHKYAGEKYVGEFEDGKAHGQGTQTFVSPHLDAGKKYVGEWKDNEFSGRGTLTFVSPHKYAGEKYVGEFEDNKYSGRGTLTLVSPHKHAGEKYVGEWKNHKRLGQGAQTFVSPHKAEGQIYVGEYKDNKFSGQGTLTFVSPHLDAGKKYVGDWKDNKFSGQGTMTFVSPHKYAGAKHVGEWKDGKVHGQGTRTRISPHKLAGQNYSGNWKDDKTNGPGTLTFVSPHMLAGQKYVGEWKNNKRHGQGTETLANGVVRTGIWENGTLKIAQKVSPDVVPKKPPTPKVAIKPKRKPSPPIKSSTSGSGFFVSKLGHIVTNQHVVNSCKRLTVGDNANSQVQAIAIETDRRNDLALLKISSTEMASEETKSLIRKLDSPLTSNLGLKVVPLSSNGLLRSDDVELGESLLVAGYPYGEIFSNTIKVTKGIVSAIRGIGDDSGQFQLDAAVQPGNSGGPIYDENGNIVGVVVAQLNKLKMAKTIGSMPENVNFGIKASTVRQFLTASGLPTKWSSRSQSMSTKKLAKIAKNQTVMVVCHR
jgi:S1-C subfamily serine protease